MKVRCIAELPNNEQAQQLGIGKHYFPGREVFGVKSGEEYVVFGIRVLSGAPWIDILEDFGTGYLHPVPMCLFIIIDGRVSHYWEVRVSEYNNLFCRPPSFLEPYYDEDLADGVKAVVDDFRKIRPLIEEEAGLE
jgi:hypothetical protein